MNFLNQKYTISTNFCYIFNRDNYNLIKNLIKTTGL